MSFSAARRARVSRWQRAFDDPRNALVREFVRLVAELDARCFVFENVKGLTVGPHRRFLEELIETFEDLGYRIRLPWRVLNAAHYGVPQDRERLFLIGAKRGVDLPEYPSPTTRPAGTADGGLPPGPSCADALGDLPDADDYAELLDGDAVRTGNWGIPSAFAKDLRCLDNDAWAFGHPRLWDPGELTASARTRHTEISRRRFSETVPGTVEPISRFFRLPGDGVHSEGGYGFCAWSLHQSPALTSGRAASPFGKWRACTASPTGSGSIRPNGTAAGGNAVPPPLARAVAARILRALGVSPSASSDVLEPGSEFLLRMDMSQAARYWRIPVGRRDRKSGARKRKQEDIEADRLRAGGLHA